MDRDRLSQQKQHEASAQVPAEDTLSDVEPCAFCGYDLRGLARGGRCPECGAVIPLNRLFTLARFGGEAWLRRAERGVRLWCIALIGFLSVPALALWAAAAINFQGTGASIAWYVVAGMLLSGFGLAVCVAAFGLWGLSARHPVIDRTEPAISARRVVRVAVCWAVVAAMMGIIQFGSPSSSAWADAVVLSLPFAGAIALPALAWRVAQLCQLAGDKESATRARSVLVVFALACVLEVPAVLIASMEPVMAAAVVLIGLVILGSCFVLFLVPAFLVKHVRAALAELASESEAADSGRATEGIDDVRPQSTRRT